MWEQIVTSPVTGLVFILTFVGAAAWQAARLARQKATEQTVREYRVIEFFEQLDQAVLMGIEGGQRINYSLGSGSVFDTAGAAAISGLAGLSAVAPETELADRPMLVSVGDGAVSLLAEQTQISALRAAAGANNVVTGLTPFSFAAGVALETTREACADNILMGHFGAEAGLINDSGFRMGGRNFGGSDSLVGQAVIAATGDSALIGEELFAGPAYMTGRRGQSASDRQSPDRWQTAFLLAQDMLRWVIIGLIIAGLLFELFTAL